MEEKSTETRLAVIETDIKYIKGKVDGMDFTAGFEKQGARIGSVEQELAVLKAKLSILTGVLVIVGTTAVAALTTAVLRLIMKQ